jgi:hypothetical protein
MIRFILDNMVDASTLTTEEAIVTPPNYVDNLKKVPRLTYFRSDDANTALTVKGTLTSPEDGWDIDSFVMVRHNFSTDITYRLLLYSDYDWTGATVFDSGVTSISGEDAASSFYEWGEFDWGAAKWGGGGNEDENRQFYDLVWWFDQVYPEVKSWQILFDISGSGSNPIFCNNQVLYCNNPVIWCSQLYLVPPGSGGTGLPFYEIGRIYLGKHEGPQYNISYGHALSWDENTVQVRPSSGTLRSDFTTSNKRMEFSLKTIPQSDRFDLHRKLIAKGLKEDFYVSIFPEDDAESKRVDYSGMVKFTTVPKYKEFVEEYYNSSFVMEEI